MKRFIARSIVGLACLFAALPAQAAYESRFDAINFDPAVDGGNYFTVYGSQTLKAWQGNLGVTFDYANRPLEFRTSGAASIRQSVLDHSLVMNVYGALGFTDWFSVGMNIPVVLYNRFFTDNAAALADHGSGMGDILLMTKFRILDIEKHRIGLAIMPYMTLPTGDIVRYNGNGHIQGGAKLIVDGRISDRLEISANVGALLRDDVTRRFNFGGGIVSSIRVDDLFTYGLGVNYKVGANKNWHLIAETQGQTVMRSFFSDSTTTSLEAGGGVRYIFGESGFATDVGGTAGLIEGYGTPKFRALASLRWTAPGKKETPPPAPDPRIQGNKIIMWGKVFFDTAKATIKPISFPVLDDVVDVLVKNPGITLVEVQGHTDHRGSDSYNLDLSQRRSESVRQYLISKGVDSSRLVAKGYGESQPIASNETVEGMSQNRRVEMIILSHTPDVNYSQTPNSMDVTVNQNAAQVNSNQGVPVAATTGQIGSDGQELPNYSY